MVGQIEHVEGMRALEERERVRKGEFAAFADAQETSWRQEIEGFVLKEGDSNTKFFIGWR